MTWQGQPAEDRQRAPMARAGHFAHAIERGAGAILDHAAKACALDPDWPDRDRVVLAQLPGTAPQDGLDLAAPSAGGALATAVGLALAERLLAARFGRTLVDHRSWAVTDPGDLLSGLGHEAAGLAGALRLERLAVLCMTTDARPAVDDTARRFAAQGWAVKYAAEADHGSLEAALSFAQRARKPTLILCRATDGPCFIADPDDAHAHRGTSQRRIWLRRLARHPRREAFLRGWQGQGAEAPREALAALAATLRDDPTTARVLAWLASLAELNCCVAGAVPRDGALDCGLRIQGLAAALLGLTLHGGLTPCGIAPLSTADLLRPSLRAVAASGRRALAILLDDEGAAGDEHLAGLRAVPGLFVMRPADVGEAVACLERALRGGSAAYAIVLPPRLLPGGLPTASRGGHLVVEPPGRRALTLVATGAELAVARAAQSVLAGEGVAAAVVSLPCWEVFALQEETYRSQTLGSAPRIGVEAGSGFGWERWLGRGGRFAGASLDGVLELARRLGRQ